MDRRRERYIRNMFGEEKKESEREGKKLSIRKACACVRPRRGSDWLCRGEDEAHSQGVR